MLAIDEIAAKKPFLLQIGLPVPVKCTLEGAGIGATRICHFDSGVIEEKILVVTSFSRPTHAYLSRHCKPVSRGRIPVTNKTARQKFVRE